MHTHLRFFGLAAALFSIASHAGCHTGQPPTPEARLVSEAAAALGGVDRIRSVQTMTLEGEGEIDALGQGRRLDGPPLKWQATSYRRAIDFQHGRWRDRWTQTPTYLTGYPDPRPVVVGYDENGDVAFDVDDGHASRQDALTARDRRAELYHTPIGFLRAALTLTSASNASARLEFGRSEDIEDKLDLILPSGERYTLFLHHTTHLPTRISSNTHVAALGDVNVETRFGPFIEAGSNASGVSGAAGASGAASGVKVPSRITVTFDGRQVSDLRIAKATVNPTPDALGDLAAPAEARAATASTPPNVKVDEVAAGVWYLTGEAHHSVVMEFADHLTLIEAPVDDARTLAVIAKARALRPAKPVTQVINTHHHFDHSGGLRAAISEGLTVITHEINRPFYERMAKRPATIMPDALAKQPRPLTIETVAESSSKVLTDGTRRLEIYPITGSLHCDGMLMVYFPKEKLLVEADAYQPVPAGNPPPRMHPFAGNLLDNIRSRGLRVDRVLPIHVRMAPFDDLVAAARTSATH
jgi:glyoxylase-like metal-dependent hydrolase (beta-lactamase superfamily II)